LTTTTATPIHIVTARDAYDGFRCGRCRKPAQELDVLIVDGRTVTHYDCATQKQREGAARPAPEADRCWYMHVLAPPTSQGCPLPIRAHRLCAVHDDILYGAPEKKQTSRR
jgi:hypothetical protein